jgi:hypothetical protein
MDVSDLVGCSGVLKPVGLNGIVSVQTWLNALAASPRIASAFSVYGPEGSAFSMMKKV